MSPITDEEIGMVTAILSRLEPGMLPLPIFLQFARLYVSCILEVVPLYDDKGRIKVLLQERDSEDPIWGGKLHTAGTVLRATDTEGDFASAFERIIGTELQNLRLIGQPIFVGTKFHQVARGRELAIIHYAELASDEVARVGRLYDVADLPESIVDTQIGFIRAAVDAFISSKSARNA